VLGLVTKGDKVVRWRNFLTMAITGLVGIGASMAAAKSADLKELKKMYERPASVPHPEDNQPNAARVKLGHMLFFEPRLSGSKVMSCATCHNPSLGWEDGLPLGVGHGHKQLGRKSPTVLNLAWAPRLFWDGRAASLEEQALGPIESEGEMNMPLEGAVKTLKGIKGYKKYFESAYPGEGISTKTIAKAIASYERTVVSEVAPFDKWLKGDNTAISKAAVRGFKVFNGKAKCNTCHSGWSFTDHSFHDIGVKGSDLGRGKLLKLQSMQFAFKTPGLRNINERGPYMHNGTEKTLMEVVEFYNRGGDAKRPSLSSNITKLKLSRREKKDLVAFMNTLTSADKPVVLPVLPQ
jgi:cytochrome c peroxidase